jgi:hypothetical protein
MACFTPATGQRMDQALADIGVISAYRFADDGSASGYYQGRSETIFSYHKPLFS